MTLVETVSVSDCETTLAADGALPTRDVVLDATRMGLHLARLLGRGTPLPLRSCVRTGAKYRWAESLRVVYRLDLGDALCTVAGRMFASPELAAKAAADAARRIAPDRAGRLPAVTFDPAHRMVWFVAPADRRLRHLDALDHPPAGLANLPLGRWETTELVQYAPERSATFRAGNDVGATLGYAKLYRHAEDATDLARFYDDVAAGLGGRGAAVRVPRALGTDPTLGVMVLEPMAGVPWNLLDPRQLPATASAMGEGLAHLHELDRHERRAFERLRPDRVTHATELIAAARPDLAVLAARVGARLAASAPPNSAPVLLHGDVHPKNILVADGAVSLIDLDQAGWGSAANDVGSMLARLAHGALVGELAAADRPGLATAFSAGYGTVRPLVGDAELRWHVAAALVVERTLRAVTRLHPVGIAAMADTLTLALNTIDGAPL